MGAAWSVLVLYSLGRLHMGEGGFGLLTTAGAVGAILGTVSFAWLERQLAVKTLMRGCLVLEVLTHLSLVHTTVPWVPDVELGLGVNGSTPSQVDALDLGSIR